MSIPVARAVQFALVGGLGLLGAMTMWPVLLPAVWAVLLAYLTFPLLRRLQSIVRSRTGAALIMTLVVCMAVLLPLTWLGMELKSDAGVFVESIPGLVKSLRDWQVPQWLRELPFVGPRIVEAFETLVREPRSLEAPLLEWVQERMRAIPAFAGKIGAVLLAAGVMVLTLFFCYRDGARWTEELRIATTRLIGPRADPFLQTARATLRGVVFGMFGTSLLQAVVAGAGYVVAGVPAPFVFAALTAIVALLPFGTAVVWAPLALLLVAQGRLVAGIGLGLWGSLVVMTIDNFVRPLLIGSAAHLHYLTVTLGVIGGSAMFGISGLLIGPLVLGLLIALWNAWLNPHGVPVPTAELQRPAPRPAPAAVERIE